jgi:hypothetical protein
MPYFSGKGESNPYAVGNRIYGGTRSFPNLGPSDPMGYRERDLKTRAMRFAALRRMQQRLQGNYMSADNLRSER